MSTATKPVEEAVEAITTPDGELIVAQPVTSTITIGGVEVGVSDAFLATLQKMEVPQDNIEAPDPVTTLAMNPQQLCNLPTRFPGASHESAPMVLVYAQERLDFEVNKPYKGLLVAGVVHPVFGAVLLRTAHSKIDDNGEAQLQPVTYHLTQVVKMGQAFKLAAFPTSKGNPIVKPIPVS